MTKRMHWLEGAQKCYTPRCCRWPRKAKWWCGCAIRSIRRHAARGLGRQGTSRMRFCREVRHEPASSGQKQRPNVANGPGKRQEHRKKMARRSSRCDRDCWATTGESARRTSVVRTDGGSRFGTIVGKDILGSRSLAPRDTHSRTGAPPGCEGGRAGARLRFCFFRAGFFRRRAGGRRFCAHGLPGRQQFEEPPDGSGRASTDSRSECGASRRDSGATEKPGLRCRLYCDEPEL